MTRQVEEYAKTSWRIGDVTGLFNVTEEEAAAFLQENEKALRDSVIEHGNAVLESLGFEAGLKTYPDDEDEDDEEDEDGRA